MDDTGIAFSWGWFWATLLGAVLGFVAGEVIESVVTALWARRGRRKRNLPIKDAGEQFDLAKEIPDKDKSELTHPDLAKKLRCICMDSDRKNR